MTVYILGVPLFYFKPLLNHISVTQSYEQLAENRIRSFMPSFFIPFSGVFGVFKFARNKLEPVKALIFVLLPAYP
jgi:hypothetical protein